MHDNINYHNILTGGIEEGGRRNFSRENRGLRPKVREDKSLGMMGTPSQNPSVNIKFSGICTYAAARQTITYHRKSVSGCY